MKKLISLFLLFFTLTVCSQKEANYWYFGQNAGLDFSNCEPVAITDGQLNTFEGCSTISNSNGDLLFYSDGTTVWDRRHLVMPGGTGLLGNSSSAQSALFVPNPTNSSIYYLFVVGDGRNPGFSYYTIDLSSNGGFGSIVGSAIDLSNGQRTSWTERVTAIQSNTSNEFWIISAAQRTLYAYKVNSEGVDIGNPVTSIINTSDIGARGSLKISPDGTKLVITSQDTNPILFDFSTERGTATNIKTLDVDSNNSYGVEFSQSGDKLYISTGNPNQGNSTSSDAFLYQYDLTEESITEINSSRETITSWSGFRGALQLGSDARIYYARSGQSFLGVINDPEESGAKANYVADGISLGGKMSTEGLPPFIQSFFKAALLDIDSGERITGDFIVCIGNTKRLGINNISDFDDAADLTQPITYKWYRNGVLLSGESSSSITVGGPSRNTNGTYLLQANYFNTCGRERNLEAVAQIRFEPKPVVNVIPIYQQCDFDDNPNDFRTNFNLTSRESQLYTGSGNVNIEFFEESDTSFLSPVTKTNYINTTPTNVTNGNHKLVVRITNIETSCFDFGEIELYVNPTGVQTYEDVYTCELDSNANTLGSLNSMGSGNAFYNFDLKTNQIILDSGSLSLTTHDFNYFKTREDAALQTNEIVAPFENSLFVDADDIFVRISLKGSSSCESIGQFKIFIQELPIPQGNISDTYLCVNNPIDIPQLITVDLDANTGNSIDSYKWYLDGVEISGETNAILKANKGGTYKVEAIRNYINNPSKTSDDVTCIGYNTFTVIQSNIALTETIEFLDDQDDPAENSITIKISGDGDYEFALNSDKPSDFVKGDDNLSYTFTNVPPGLNKVFINDRNTCGIRSSEEVSFVFFQRYFTPNGDGNADTWKIQGVENAFYSEIKLQVFDRYGRLIQDIDQKTQNGWDGTFNGKLLPTNDYWYNAILIDINGKIRKKTGHFSLLRK